MFVVRMPWMDELVVLNSVFHLDLSIMLKMPVFAQKMLYVFILLHLPKANKIAINLGNLVRV